jgi:hypothetical protein
VSAVTPRDVLFDFTIRCERKLRANSHKGVRIDEATDKEVEIVASGLSREAATQLSRTKVGRDGLAIAPVVAGTYCVAQVEP